MHTGCTDSALALPDTLTGELPEWPEPPTETFLNCSGSAGVTKCLLDNPGSIGYIDTGHGLDAGLSEVRLQSTFDATIFFDSTEGTPIAEAITTDLLPPNATDDFSSVTFLNKGGTMTWPLILMTYIYVRTDLPSFLVQPYEQTLVVAFLRTFFNSDYVSTCTKLYGFTAMNDIPDMKAYGEAAIKLVEQSINSTATPPWFFESKTVPIDGAGPFVFSTKRKEIIDVTVQDLTTAVSNIESDLIARVDSDAETTTKIDALERQVEAILLEIMVLQSEISSGTTQESDNEVSTSQSANFTSDDASQIKAALVLSSISFIFWCFWIVTFVVRRMKRTTTSSSSSMPESTMP